MTVRDEIAKNLYFYRKRKHITQKELAIKVGVTNSAISNWEKGLNSIDIDTLYTVCVALDVSVSEMFGVYANEHFTNDEKELLAAYGNLNVTGKSKAREYVGDLAEQSKYSRSAPPPSPPSVSQELAAELAQDFAKIPTHTK